MKKKKIEREREREITFFCMRKKCIEWKRVVNL